MTKFLMKKYDVSVQGFAAHAYDANTPAQARVRAWYAYCSYRAVTFKEFMKISSVRRGTDPEGYGKPILVGGNPAFLISRDAHTVRFVRPDDTQVLNSHPLDVTDAEPQAPQPISRGNEAQMAARIEVLEGALKRIYRWVGEFPETGQYWDDPKNTEPMSYAACYGSNGERDYMRDVAKRALDASPVSADRVRWTHVKQSPIAGGLYLVGGYVFDGTLRYFARTFASYRATTEGPEWSHKRHEDHRIPIEYWCEMPAHPELLTAASEGTDNG